MRYCAERPRQQWIVVPLSSLRLSRPRLNAAAAELDTKTYFYRQKRPIHAAKGDLLLAPKETYF